MKTIKIDYKVKDDIFLYLDSNGKTIEDFSLLTNVSKRTLNNIIVNNIVPSKDILENIYSFLYRRGLRINKAKEELFKEIYSGKVIFHGSKQGLDRIVLNGTRKNCDFGDGFYLGENYSNALSFVCEKEDSSIYSFKYNDENLKIVKFDCDIDWLLAICYYRGAIKKYEKHKKIQKIINKIENSDIVIAPIADNKMFYIMSLFYEGEINDKVALHSLSASSLGKQFVFKSEKAIKQLVPIEKYYLSKNEKNNAKKDLMDRTNMIESKLKLSRREFEGKDKYIDELFK